MNKLITILFVAAMAASCGEAELHNTSHPEEGKLVVEVDDEILLPDGTTPSDSDFTIYFQGEEYSLDGGSLELDQILKPGNYDVYVYNNPDDVTIENTMTEDGSGTIIIGVTVTDGVVDSDPSDVYYAEQTITITADAITTGTLEFSSIMRELVFELEIDESDVESLIESISASLSGVASQWDCVNNVPYGDPAVVEPDLELTQVSASSSLNAGEYQLLPMTRADGASYYILKASVKIVGIHPTSSQVLTIDMDYVGGNPESHTIESDISDQLATFNSDKSEALVLSSSVNLPTNNSSGGSIGDWNSSSEGEVTVK